MAKVSLYLSSLIGVFVTLSFGVYFYYHDYRLQIYLEKEGIIVHTEQAIDNFIKIKEENLFKHDIRFVAYLQGKPPILSQFNEKDYFTVQGEEERSFLKIYHVDDLKKFQNYEDEDLQDTLLGLLEPSNDKKEMKNFFSDFQDILSLMLIIRLGVFGDLQEFDKAFRSGLFKKQNLPKIKNSSSFFN